MSEMLRFVIKQINKMFGTDYNMISFDSLPATPLLQILADVLQNYGAMAKVNVDKSFENAVLEIIEVLKVIKYFPDKNITPIDFREGVIMGKRNIVHPILHWLLSNPDEVKNRVYLAKYLQKIELPLSLSSNEEIQAVYNQCNNLIKEFKTAHMETVKFEKSFQEVAELRKDLEKMNNDIVKVEEHLRKQEEKVANISGKETLLVSAKAFRDKLVMQKKLVEQKQEQQDLIAKLETEIKSVQDELNEFLSLSFDSKGLLVRLQEECKINENLVKNKLAQELSDAREREEVYNSIINELPATEEEINKIKKELEDTKHEVNKLIDIKVEYYKPKDDTLGPFRMQARMVENQKKELEGKLIDVKEKLSAAEKEIEENQSRLNQLVGGKILHGEELKQYVAKLRARSVLFKEYKNKLEILQTETGIMSRTREVLIQNNGFLNEALSKKDENSENSSVTERIGDVQAACKELVRQCDSDRAHIAQIREELQSLQSKKEQLTEKYNKMKEAYDSSTAGLPTEIKKLESEIKALDSSITLEESNWKNLQREIEEKEDILFKVTDNTADTEGKDFLTHLENLVSEAKKKEERKNELMQQHEKLLLEQETIQQELTKLSYLISFMEVKLSSTF